MKISPSVSGKTLIVGLGSLSYVSNHNVSMLKGTTFWGATLNQDCPNVMLSVSVYRRRFKKQQSLPLYSDICGKIDLDKPLRKKECGQ
jgi:hypothetical protein